MYFRYFNLRRFTIGMSYLFSIYLYTRILEVKKDLIFIIIICSATLLLLGILDPLQQAIKSDIVNILKSFALFKKKSFLFVIWILSLFLGIKAGIFPWFFDSFDQATLLAFSIIPALVLFNSSVRTLILFTVSAWIYVVFLYIYNFEQELSHFVILTFWLFLLSLVISIVKLEKNRGYV